MSMTRRGFMQIAGGLVAGAVAGGAVERAIVKSEPPPYLTHINVGDIHSNGRRVTGQESWVQGLDQVTNQLGLSSYDVLTLNGDFCTQHSVHRPVSTTEHNRVLREDILEGQIRPLIKAAGARPVLGTLGNHDLVIYGQSLDAGVYERPDIIGEFFGWEKGRYYHSQTVKDVRFVTLRSMSIDETAASAQVRGVIDQTQMDWLDGELKEAQQQNQWVVIITHAPLLTTALEQRPAYMSHPDYLVVANRQAVREQLEGYENIVCVVQGHTHYYESIECNRIRYISGGSLAGNYWNNRVPNARHFAEPGYLVLRYYRGGPGGLRVVPEYVSLSSLFPAV